MGCGRGGGCLEGLDWAGLTREGRESLRGMQLQRLLCHPRALYTADCAYRLLPWKPSRFNGMFTVCKRSFDHVRDDRYR